MRHANSEIRMCLRLRGPHRGNYPADIRLRGCSEETPVLAGELGGAFVAHQGARAPGGHVLIEHQLPRLLQPKQL